MEFTNDQTRGRFSRPAPVSFRVVLALVLAGIAFGGLAMLAAAEAQAGNGPKSPPPGHGRFKDVDPDRTTRGWIELASTCGGVVTGSQGFVMGPAALGSGSYEFQIGSDGNTFRQLRHAGFNGESLADLELLRYSALSQSGGTGQQAVYANLLVDLNGDGTTDDQLFFEPVYQTGTYSGDPVPNQGALATGVWQTWDATAGGWWSLNAFTFGPPLTTLASYVAANPTATLADHPSGAVRLVAGCGAGAWTNWVGNVDAVEIDFAGNPKAGRYDLGG